VTAISIYSGVVLAGLENAPDGSREIDVTGQQFAWSFSYPDAEVTSGQLVLEVDEPVRLTLTSKDVIHSFWVPEFRMKQDAVPGTETHVVITPTKVGTYEVICTELCGLGHAVMRSQAVVLGPSDYEKWMNEQKSGGAAAGGGGGDGKALFASNGCGSCHTLADSGSTAQVGPNLDEVLKGKDTEFVRTSIADPDAEVAPGFQPGIMPKTFGDQLSDEQLDALVKYLLDSTKGG
jgi:cytochrome c oxidase subunit II